MTKFRGKEILHNSDYEAITVTISKATTGTETVSGRKVLPAGTPVFGENATSIFDERNQKAIKATSNAKADGVTLHDVDLTDGDAATAIVYRGTVKSTKVEGYTEELKTALPLIKFVADK